MREKIVKSIAILLVTVILYSYFGTVISYAAENLIEENQIEMQGTSTDNDNVEFDVYYENNKHSKSIDIGSTGTKLYIDINIKNVGYIQDSSVNFSNANFKITNVEPQNLIQSLDKNVLTLKQINSRTVIELTIIPDIKDVVSDDFCNKQNTASFKGTYVNAQNKSAEVLKDIKFNTYYTKDSSTVTTNLTQELTKYIPYSINGKSGLLLQTDIQTGIQDNVLPVDSSTLKVTFPKINDEFPQTAIVVATTTATNGSTKEETLNLNSDNYDLNTGILTITTVNKNNLGTLSWLKNATDNYKIIVVYSPNVYTAVDGKTIELTIKSEVQNSLISYNNVKTSKTAGFTNSYSETMGKLVDVKADLIEDSINKGYIYNNANSQEDNKLETIYNEKYNVFITNSEIVDSIKINQNTDKFMKDTKEYSTTISGNNYAYDKEISINLENMQRILGVEGTLEILTGDTPIATIDKNSKADVNGNIIVDISSRNLNNVSILTSKPIIAGTLEINIKKAISKNIGYSVEQVKTFNKMKTSTTANVLSGVESVVASIAEDEASLVDPTAKASISINKDKLSTIVNNEGVEIRAVLETNSIDDYMYDNPKIEIKLPQHIQTLNVKSIGLLYSDELTIESNNIVDNDDGTKTIIVNINGKQTKYNDTLTNGPTVVITCDIAIDPTTPSTSESITLSCVDANSVTVQNTCNFEYAAPVGLVTINSIKNANGDNSEVMALNGINETVTINPYTTGHTATITGRIINNLSGDISNTKIFYKIPTSGVDDNTFNLLLKSAVSIPSESGKVYYTENANATSDLELASNNWTENVTDYSKVKAFEIVVTNNVSKSSDFTFTYQVDIPDNLEYNNTDKLQYSVNYNEESNVGSIPANSISPIITVTTGIGPKLDVTISTSAVDNKVKQGQLLNVEANITNSGAVAANNASLVITIPSGTSLVEYNYGNAIFQASDSDTTVELGTINQGETKTVKYILKVNNDAEVGNNINVKVNATANNNLYEEQNQELAIEQGYLYVNNRTFVGYPIDGTITEGLKKDFIVTIQNQTSSEVNSLNMEYQLPTNTVLESVGVVSVDQDDISGIGEGFSVQNNKIIYQRGSLAANELIKIKMTVIVGNDDSFNTIAKVNGKIANNDIGTHYSNELNFSIEKIDLELKPVSQDNQEVKEGKEVVYEFQVTNNSNAVLYNNKIYSILSEGIEFKKAELQFSTESEITTVYEVSEDGLLYNKYKLQPKENINIKIYAKTAILKDQEITDNVEKPVTTTIKYRFNDNGERESTLKYYLIYDKDAHNEAVDEDGIGEPGHSEATTSYKIAGKVWFDENKNGQREESENGISNVKLLLLDANTSNIVKDKDTKLEKTTTTDANGEYIFNNLVPGKYLVVFLYETGKYSITEYHKAGILDSQNSDAIDMDIVYEGQNMKAGLTDSLTIVDSNIRNIDLGLTTAGTFDVRVEKTINKITVKTPKGTQVYDYSSENKKLSKVEIESKYLDSSTVVVEYKIKVINKGNVSGYVKKVIDYLPDNMKFNSELNKQWYLGTDKNAYNLELANTEIKPGEIKELSIVLTKTMTSNTTGVVSNSAKIYEAYNKEGIANKNSNDNDAEQANVIISVKTGQTVLYLTIAIISLIIIGIGLFEIREYVVNKK